MDKIETNLLILRRFIGRYHKRALDCFCQAMNGWSRNGQEREANKM
ncbi:hypothetical protein B4133_1897 [Bacillus altitudinis]|nr:hypothetical protein B4133_1897 [Bacillus altitudinis]